MRRTNAIGLRQPRSPAFSHEMHFKMLFQSGAPLISNLIGARFLQRRPTGACTLDISTRREGCPCSRLKRSAERIATVKTPVLRECMPLPTINDAVRCYHAPRGGPPGLCARAVSFGRRTPLPARLIETITRRSTASAAYLAIMPKITAQRFGNLCSDWRVEHAWHFPIRGNREGITFVILR